MPRNFCQNSVRNCGSLQWLVLLNQFCTFYQSTVTLLNVHFKDVISKKVLCKSTLFVWLQNLRPERSWRNDQQTQGKTAGINSLLWGMRPFQTGTSHTPCTMTPSTSPLAHCALMLQATRMFKKSFCPVRTTAWDGQVPLRTRS